MRLLRRKKSEDAGQEPAGSEGQGDGAVAVSADGAAGEPADREPTAVAAGRADGEVAAASADGEDAGAGDGGGPGDAAIAMVDAQQDADGQEEVAAAPPAPQPMAAGPPLEEEGDERLPASFYFEGLLKLKDDRPPSREELDRQAAADFQAAIAPAVGPLHELVPDASGPEDALRQLTERWEEPLPDPEGEAARGQDPFTRGPAETAVYYRIRRHFDSPRRHVGFGREAWRPPPGLAREAMPNRGRTRQELPSGRRSRRS
ncbi:MAG TPA: hypothetical protein VHF24_01375 [Acidimicrobiales bacterium]|nr:hypothetical protein [Acidimicrobiales bacterium]